MQQRQPSEAEGGGGAASGSVPKVRQEAAQLQAAAWRQQEPQPMQEDALDALATAASAAAKAATAEAAARTAARQLLRHSPAQLQQQQQPQHAWPPNPFLNHRMALAFGGLTGTPAAATGAAPACSQPATPAVTAATAASLGLASVARRRSGDPMSRTASDATSLLVSVSDDRPEVLRSVSPLKLWPSCGDIVAAGWPGSAPPPPPHP